MSTVTMNISLNDDLKAFVDSRIKTRGYSSTSEYVRDLVRRDEERAKEKRFKALIQDGLDSGPGRPWDEIRAGFLTDIGAAKATAAPKANRLSAKSSPKRISALGRCSAPE